MTVLADRWVTWDQSQAVSRQRVTHITDEFVPTEASLTDGSILTGTAGDRRRLDNSSDTDAILRLKSRLTLKTLFSLDVSCHTSRRQDDAHTLKVHKVAIQKLFTSNDQVFDTQQIYDLACELAAD